MYTVCRLSDKVLFSRYVFSCRLNCPQLMSCRSWEGRLFYTRRLAAVAVKGQYWAGRTPRPNNGPPNMAAANFVVITNGEGCTLNGTAVAAVLSTNSMPRAFFPRVANGCRLSLKIDRNLSPFWAGTLPMATWYDTAWIGGKVSIWIEYLYRCVVAVKFFPFNMKSETSSFRHDIEYRCKLTCDAVAKPKSWCTKSS